MNFAFADIAGLQIECSRCKAARDVDMAALTHPATTFVHDQRSRLRCRECAKAGRRPSASTSDYARSHRARVAGIYDHARDEAETRAALCRLGRPS
jgi:hypothetical protein